MGVPKKKKILVDFKLKESLFCYDAMFVTE